MQTTIHRYKIGEGLSSVSMPVDASILGAQPSRDGIAIIVIVSPDAEMAKRHFAVVETGVPLPREIRSCRYIATLQKAEGNPLVGMKVTNLHVFEVPKDQVKTWKDWRQALETD